MTSLPHDVIPDIMSYIDDQTFLTHHYNLVIRSPRLEKHRQQILQHRTRGRLEKVCSQLIIDMPDLLNAQDYNNKIEIFNWIIEDLVWGLIPYKEKFVYLYKRTLCEKIITSNLILSSTENRFVPSIMKKNLYVDATYRLQIHTRNFLRKNHFGVLALIY